MTYLLDFLVIGAAVIAGSYLYDRLTGPLPIQAMAIPKDGYLAVKLPFNTSNAQIAEIQKRLEHRIPEVKTLVFTGDVELTAIEVDIAPVEDES